MQEEQKSWTGWADVAIVIIHISTIKTLPLTITEIRIYLGELNVKLAYW